MSKNSVTLDLNNWINSYSTFMADEALKLLKAKTKEKGVEVGRAVALSFISKILSQAVLDVLHDRPIDFDDKKLEEKAAFVQKAFLEFKMATQDAVAMSFQTAMSHYTGKSIEYYCLIKVVPPMITDNYQ